MITITNASKYTTKSEMAYSITYSDGTTVRAVESKGNIVRKEWLKDGEWVAVGKPYVVEHNRKRHAERMIETVKAWIN